AVCLLALPVLLSGEAVFLLLGQETDVAALVGDYMRSAAWAFIPATLFVVLRALVSAHGETRIIFVVTIVAILANVLGNYALMFGNFGFPRLELFGGGIATSLSHALMFGLLLGHVLRHRRLKRYRILARFWKPDWPRFFAIFRLGTPIGLMLAAETSLFGMAGVFMGWIGTAELAGHAVAMQIISLTFMIPLGISQAATIRVGLEAGRESADGLRIAGWVAMALATLAMMMSATLYWLSPTPLVHLFFDPARAENLAPIALAVTYLGVAAIFQIVDGLQVSAAAALRGISDTKIPAIVAITGYWLVGVPASYLLGFPAGLGGVGIWLGLAFGLAFVGIVLVWRFWRLTRS
ncbi:MAG: MATE family efflux transporter, partial [Pseudomonadota bacterium]